jgi:hypothetical protein
MRLKEQWSAAVLNLRVSTAKKKAKKTAKKKQ